jgi:hypothetical protein
MAGESGSTDWFQQAFNLGVITSGTTPVYHLWVVVSITIFYIEARAGIDSFPVSISAITVTEIRVYKPLDFPTLHLLHTTRLRGFKNLGQRPKCEPWEGSLKKRELWAMSLRGLKILDRLDDGAQVD